MIHAPTPDQLSKAIRTEADRLIADGIAADPYAINCGSCEDLAHAVIDGLGGETERLEAWWADSLSLDGEGSSWDVPLVTRLFPDSTPTHGLSWEEALHTVPAHCWIVLDGRHYDAECPEGVDNFFDLPILRTRMERIAAEAEAEDAPSPFAP